MGRLLASADMKQNWGNTELDSICSRLTPSRDYHLSSSFRRSPPSCSTPPHHVTVISCYYGYWAFLGECDCRFAVLSFVFSVSHPSLPLSHSISSPLFLYLPPMAAVKLLIWWNMYLLFCSPAEGSSCGLNTGGPQSPEWRPHLCRSTHQHGCPSLERPHPPGTVTNWKLSLLLLQTSFTSVILITYSHWRRKSMLLKQ